MIEKNSIRKAVFPVGGLGTRFLPATKAMPKEMLPVVDKPLIHYAVEEARAAGIEEFIFVTGRGKAAIEDYFDLSYELGDQLSQRGKGEYSEAIHGWLPNPGQIAYTRQQEPLGLGHAIWCARHLVGNEPFAVLLADDLMLSNTPCLKQMVEAYGSVGGNLVAVEKVPKSFTNRYGILAVDSINKNLIKASDIIEKPDPESAPSEMGVIGRYILDPGIFEKLEHTQIGAGSEIQLTDALASMIGEVTCHGIQCEGKRYDCGDRAGFILANVAFALGRNELKKELLDRLADLMSEN